MGNVIVRRLRDVKDAADPLLAEMRDLLESVKQRAFELFERRKRGDERDFDDWLQAERELLWPPPVELIEEDKGFRLKVGLPGFAAKDIQLTLMPDSIVLKAEANHEHERTHGKLLLCDFCTRKVFRRVNLPSEIDTDKATAALKEGTLTIQAPKSDVAKARRIAVQGGDTEEVA